MLSVRNNRLRVCIYVKGKRKGMHYYPIALVKIAREGASSDNRYLMTADVKAVADKGSHINNWSARAFKQFAFSYAYRIRCKSLAIFAITTGNSADVMAWWLECSLRSR